MRPGALWPCAGRPAPSGSRHHCARCMLVCGNSGRRCRPCVNWATKSARRACLLAGQLGEDGVGERRNGRGLSLDELSKLVHRDASCLAKIERGDRNVPADLARDCDRALEAGGTLVRLHAIVAAGDRQRVIPPLRDAASSPVHRSGSRIGRAHSRAGGQHRQDFCDRRRWWDRQNLVSAVLGTPKPAPFPGWTPLCESPGV